jgi:NAD(P)-dependent dehydrogenase (short-subunit alcohol dehydrogenase family)
VSDLSGKVALVTGAGGSIGAASVARFLRAGAAVALLDRDVQALARVAATLAEEAGDRLLHLPVDVTDAVAVEAAVAQTLGRFGRLDILFSNAGIDGPILSVQDYPTQVFDALQAVHVRGSFLMLRAAIPHLPMGGRVIVTASVVGVTGVPGNAAYVAAKHALVGLVRSVGMEVARRGITVNAVCPGPVDNAFMRDAEAAMSKLLGRDAGRMFDDEKIPLGRHVTAEEVADAVMWLASPGASGTTCSCLMVDGGMGA